VGVDDADLEIVDQHHDEARAWVRPTPTVVEPAVVAECDLPWLSVMSQRMRACGETPAL